MQLSTKKIKTCIFIYHLYAHIHIQTYMLLQNWSLIKFYKVFISKPFVYYLFKIVEM